MRILVCRGLYRIRTLFLWYYALWRFIAAPISSSDALLGNTGSNVTVAVPGVMRPRLGQYSPASVPTGKIGSFRWRARNSKPPFNGTCWPGFARVPSGNITKMRPFRISFSTWDDNLDRFVRPAARLTPIMPMRQNAQPYIGIHSSSRFNIKKVLRTTLEITAISRIDMCFAAIITLPSRRWFSFGIIGMPFSSVWGNITRYFMPPNMRATVNTPYAQRNTSQPHSFLFVRPINSTGDHRIKCVANATLNIIVLNMMFSFVNQLSLIPNIVAMYFIYSVAHLSSLFVGGMPDNVAGHAITSTMGNSFFIRYVARFM